MDNYDSSKLGVRAFLVLCAFLLLAMSLDYYPAAGRSSQSTASIIYVDVEASGANDGTSWEDAYTDLQDALDEVKNAAVEGIQIWVAAGIYLPTANGDRSISFQLMNGVELFGGFDPSDGEVLWEDRDWVGNATILSGDIGILGDDMDNSYHVVTGNKVDDSAILDGFTITAGYADGSTPNNNGAGMYSYQGKPRLINVSFSNNAAQDNGGGLYLYESSASLADVTFSYNSARYGGGLFNSISNSTLTMVTFSMNTASSHGGGMYIVSSNPTLIDVSFSGNFAQEHGGGMLNTNSRPTLTDVAFANNSAGRFGGGISNFSSSPVLTNTTLSNNSAPAGGGMYNQYSSPSMVEVTFSGNSGTDYGGGIYSEDSHLTISKGSFIENKSPRGGGIFTYLGELELSEVSFVGNLVQDKGGGMYSYNCSLSMQNVSFSRNSALTLGGGMANYLIFNTTLNHGSFFDNTAGDYGGAIYNTHSSLTLLNTTISANSAGKGGGIYNYWSSPAMSNITFFDNSSSYGGGIYNWGSNSALNNVTFSNNSAQLTGGGIANYYESSPRLRNVTFSNNAAEGSGGAIYIGAGYPVLTNSILWGNTPDAISGLQADVRYSDIQGGYAGIGNINLDPRLDALADNGGATLTQALLAGSPAIDSANPESGSCPLTDQRNYFRPIDGNQDGSAVCDMGAFEYGSFYTFFNFLPMLEK